MSEPEANGAAPKKKSIKKNYFYNLIYQLFALITPLVVTPHVSRVLGSSGMGQYSFTYSIATYFMLFAALGFGYYAQREIARAQGDKKEQSKIFFEIMIARSLSVGASLLIHFALILAGIYGPVYSVLMWILTINIAATAFDVAFLFQGNEEFGMIALRNVVIKAIGVAAILIFVKNEDQVWLYALCQCLILIVSNLSLWTRLPRFLTRVNPKELNIKRHFRPTLRLFIPTIAVSVYTMFDKTLIGIMVPGTTVVDGVEKKIADLENGYYDQAEKLVKMATMVVASLGTVMIPRNSQAIASNNMEEFKANISKALTFVFFLGTPIMFGLAAIAFNFSPWFFGPGYEKVPYLMMILSPLVLIIGLSNVLGLQYLLPKKEDKKYTIAITCGAGLNLALNLALIYFYWSYGACIATIVAETLVTSLMLVFSHKDVKLRNLFIAGWRYLVAGALMFGGVFLTQRFLQPNALNTVLLILEGVGIYFVLLLVLRDRFTIDRLVAIGRKAKTITKRGKGKKSEAKTTVSNNGSEIDEGKEPNKIGE